MNLYQFMSENPVLTFGLFMVLGEVLIRLLNREKKVKITNEALEVIKRREELEFLVKDAYQRGRADEQNKNNTFESSSMIQGGREW